MSILIKKKKLEIIIFKKVLLEIFDLNQKKIAFINHLNNIFQYCIKKY